MDIKLRVSSPKSDPSRPDVARKKTDILDVQKPGSIIKAKPIANDIAPVVKAKAKSTSTQTIATNKTKRSATVAQSAIKPNNDTPKPIKKRAPFKPEKLFRKVRRQLDKTTNAVVKHGRKFILDRWENIRLYRRSVISWLLLILVLITGSFVQTVYYGNLNTTIASAAGGTYIEGTTDKLSTISPLHATTDTERAASQLVFLGLLSYDNANKLHAELADSWSCDDTGKIWTVNLRPDVYWTDGQQLTANDVVFTVDLMKDSTVNSTLASSWKNISTAAVNDTTVRFELQTALMSFDTSLTFGVLPKHSLEGKSSLELASLFSQTDNPIPSTGPFIFDHTEELSGYSIWHFRPNDSFYGGKPKLDELAIRTYNSSDDLINGLFRGEVNAISNVTADDLEKFDNDKYNILQLKTSGGIFALFNNDGTITSDRRVRTALRHGLDRQAIIDKILDTNNNLSSPVKLETPIATGVYESIDKLKQPDYNLDEAAKELDNAGWVKVNGSDYRMKGDQELSLNIVTISGTSYAKVADMIAEQWQKLGVNAKVQAVDPNQAQQLYLMPRNYDVLVYQMHLGADPDMYAYWSSTQAEQTGLNLANYRSTRADLALTNARSNANAEAREARYNAFVNQWLNDVPAIALYQPSFFIVTDSNVDSLHSGDSLIDASSRFREVHSWTVGSRQVMNTP